MQNSNATLIYLYRSLAAAMSCSLIRFALMSTGEEDHIKSDELPTNAEYSFEPFDLSHQMLNKHTHIRTAQRTATHSLTDRNEFTLFPVWCFMSFAFA